MSGGLDMNGAHVCAIAQAQGDEALLTRKAHSIHVGGHVNVWVCGYCARSTKGTKTNAPASCKWCGAALP